MKMSIKDVGYVSLLLMVLVSSCGRETEPMALATETRGKTFVGIDLPETPGTAAERVLIGRDARGVYVSRGPRMALLPNGDRNDRSHVWLEPAQWQPVEALQQQWCQARPIFPPIRAGEPFYHVTVACDPFVREFMIPVAALPSAFQDILRAIPPP